VNLKNSFIKNTFYLTGATIISKILGFIYIMPFTFLVGTSGYALYKYAYGPYTVMLSISTLGLPLAVSKYISKYNSLGNYRASKDLLKYGLILMFVTGVLSFILLYTLSPYLASFVTSSNDLSGNSYADVLFVIRMVSFALIVVPPMSLLRGFFQGNHYMKPSALSTVIEQVFRISFILLGAVLILKVFNGSITQAVGIGTFGAFIGGFAGLIILIIIYLKKKNSLPVNNKQITEDVKIPLLLMLKELISYAIPFVIIGLAIPIYQNIDTFTINSLFRSIGYTQSHAENINSVIGLAQILVLIPVSLATSFSISLIPSITGSFNQGNQHDVIHQVKKTFQILVFFSVPAAFGLCLLSKPVYTMVFGLENNPVLGGEILGWYAPMTILFSLFTVTTAILQGINNQNQAIIGMTIGVIIKIAFIKILVIHFQEIGPIVSTYAGYTVSVLINFYIIKKKLKIPIMGLLKPLIPITILVFIMSLCIKVTIFIIEQSSYINQLSDYWIALITSTISIFAGLVTYLYISSKLGIIKILVNK
jgi:O-antigen/teichoic acid export membrane protein